MASAPSFVLAWLSMIGVSIGPGTQVVHADAAILELCRPGSSERAHSGLSRAIRGVPGEAHVASGRTDQGDRAAITHQRHCLLRREERRADIQIEYLVEMSFGD